MSPSKLCIIADGGVKKDATTAITHIWQSNSITKHISLHATKVTSTEAEIMAIRLGLNHAIYHEHIENITVITDSIHAARKIFDSSNHPYWSITAPIAKEIHTFLAKSPSRSINVWHCPTNSNWKQHSDVDKDVKASHISPILPSKESWDYSKKEECDNLSNYWKMCFQASDSKGHHCHEPPLWLSPFLLFFSRLFSFLFIAWESLSHYVTQVVTMSRHGHVTWSHGRVGK